MRNDAKRQRLLPTYRVSTHLQLSLQLGLQRSERVMREAESMPTVAAPRPHSSSPPSQLRKPTLL